MRKVTIASALVLLAACSPNPTPQPMGSVKADASKPDRAKPEEPKAGAPEVSGLKKYPFSLSDEEWRKRLTPEQYEVCRKKGTEARFCKGYQEMEKHGKGSYACSACDQVVFVSDAKFHSGSGWPSFFAPVTEKSIEKIQDKSHDMDRVEVVCSNCGSHLGHVFPDGPPPTRLRFCMNAVSLKFNAEKDK